MAIQDKNSSDSKMESAGNKQGARQMFTATCVKCGKSTEVPFQPRSGKPVYCKDCYSLHERGLL